MHVKNFWRSFMTNFYEPSIIVMIFFIMEFSREQWGKMTDDELFKVFINFRSNLVTVDTPWEGKFLEVNLFK